MKKSILLYTGIAISAILIAATTLSIDDFFLPGSQIGQSGNLESPDRCDNCHGGYDQAVEPAFNWRGSMMAMATRDPLFYACLNVANNDAPGVGDLCLRCHTPDGWLNGRCEPTDGSALNQNDREGVQCDFCHKLVTPLQKDENGEYINPYPEDGDYTSDNYGTITFEQDKSYVDQIVPVSGTTANGMYLADANNAKRGPFNNAVGRHQMIYSPFHKEAALCGTCHDVSNPAFIRQSTNEDEYVFIERLEGGDKTLAELNYDLRHMFPVERTYSEWLASGYNSADGKTCQDCHMKNVTGKGAKMKDAPLRQDLPLHDFTGGNTFTPQMIMDHPVWQNEVNPEALLAGIERARTQLKSAADFELSVDKSTNTATVTITNKTGHKLPTGYPEGRRMWINVKVYYSNKSEKEFGAYNENNFDYSISDDTEVYECKPGFSDDWAKSLGKEEGGPTFHFAINNKVWKDNRIPPEGFDYDLLEDYQSPVVIDGDAVRTRYSNNSDTQTFDLGTGYVKVEAKLLYQTTSPEYVFFLQQNGGAAGQELFDLWDLNGRSAPEVMNEAIWEDAGYVPPISPLEANFKEISGLQTVKQGTFAFAEIMVTSSTLPVQNAQVTVDYSGTTSGTLTLTTGSDGKVIAETKPTKRPKDPWCFHIADVTLTDDYKYEIPKPLTSLCIDLPKSAYLTDAQALLPITKVYPNPFTDKLYFEFSREMDEKCLIEVFDVTGRKLDVVFNQMIEAGQNYKVEYSADKISTDMLFYRMQFNEEIVTGKVVHQ